MFDSIISLFTGRHRHTVIFGILFLGVIIGILSIAFLLIFGILFAT